MKTMVLAISLMAVLATKSIAKPPAIERLALMDATTGRELVPLKNGGTLELADRKHRDLSICAVTKAPAPGSVRFIVGDKTVRTVNASPFAFTGHKDGVLGCWRPSPGVFRLKAIPYSQANGKGQAGTPLAITLTVTDSLAHRVAKLKIKAPPSSVIRIVQRRHAFPFGSVLGNRLDAKLSGISQEDAKKYRETFLANFNYAVAENSMKWYHNHNRIGKKPNTKLADAMVKWCDEHKIPMRGHTIYWGARPPKKTKTNQMWDPDWVEALPDKQFLAECRNRAVETTRHFKDKITDWDLDNEMMHGNYYKKRMGKDYFNTMIKWAREGHPKCRLFVNDFGVIISDKCTEKYWKQIDELRKAGTDVGGIGLQSHIYGRITAESVKRRLDKLSSFKLPIWITECDIQTGRGEKKADNLETFMTACFAHPSVEGFILWGFWEKAHWKKAAALWNADWSIRPIGRRYRELVYKRWWTDVTGYADRSGTCEMTVFHGTYAVTVNGVTKTVTIGPKGAVVGF